jgi:hypothetical protein
MAVRAYNAVMEHPQLVVLKSFGRRVDAELAKSAVESAGIEAIIRSDSVGGMREDVARSGAGFQILVREDDVPAASEALIPVADPDFTTARGNTSFWPSGHSPSRVRSRWKSSAALSKTRGKCIECGCG